MATCRKCINTFLFLLATLFNSSWHRFSSESISSESSYKHQNLAIFYLCHTYEKSQWQQGKRNRYKKLITYSDHAEHTSQITQNHCRSHRTIADHTVLVQTTQNHHRLHRTNSDHTEKPWITQSHHRSHRTIRDNTYPLQIQITQIHHRYRSQRSITVTDHKHPLQIQITQNHHRSHRISSDHMEPAWITQIHPQIYLILT